MKILGLIAILLLFLIPVSYAQNTKGDKTQSQRIGRENKVGLTKKKRTKSKSSANRVQGRRSSQANRANASKPPKIYPQNSPPSVTAKFKKQNIKSSGSQANNRSVSGQQAKRSGQRVQPRSATGRTRNVYPQQGPYVNYSSKPRSSGNTYSNRQQVARNSKSGYRPEPPKRKRVTPSSASRSYISRRSINAFAGFWNKKPKEEKAYVGDITGRKLRTKNYETKRPVYTNPTAHPYHPKKRVGDRPYKGPSGGYMSASRSGKAWRGDIAGRRIRGRNFTSKKTTEGTYKGTGGGYKSVSGKYKKGQGSIPGKPPGIGGRGVDTYQGNIKGRKVFSPQGAGFSGYIKAHKPLKGGGSVSGRAWNNNGQALVGKGPRGANVGAYQGNIKGGKKSFSTVGADYSGNIKGGKKTFSTVGADYSGNIKGGKKTFSAVGADYSGNIKARKPLKGGGSISGKVWNNNGQAVVGKGPGGVDVGAFRGNLKGGKKVFYAVGADYAGNIKAKKPVKGGGSVSGKVWNNQEQHIAGKAPAKRIRMDIYQGNIKLSKKEPSKEVGGFPGKHHQFDFQPSMIDQGEQFTGHTRLPRFKKEYIQNPNSSKESLKKTRPDKTTYLVDGLQIKVKRPDYKTKPNAAENAMRGIGPGSNSIKASEYTKAMKQNWNYKHNPNAADEALDAHEPGKAFARATDYQGNIKMRKMIFGKKGLHPDAQFVKINKNNTDEERSVLTNFKLWWARTFKKSDTQPDHLKEKYRKPRYDKREDGLWYD